MKKIIPKATFYEKRNFLDILEITIAMKIPFTIKQSTYTFEIIAHDDAGEIIVRAKFLQNFMSNKANIAYKMIKNDIVASGIEMPQIDKHHLTYNKFSPVERLNMCGETIYCIDIKQAYATVLRNKGLITAKTFGYLATLSKKDRLACVGMLAANKNIWHFDENNEEVETANEHNELSDIFYMCVMEIYNTMMRLKDILGKANFIFFWVDGIYFEWIHGKEKIENMLSGLGFKYTFEELHKFRIQERKRTWLITYWQTREALSMMKRFYINKDDFSAAKKIIDILDLHLQKNSITKQIKVQK